jgi:hypothetical protein
MQAEEFVEKSLSTFQEGKNFNNREIVNRLAAHGINEEIAWRIICFVPLAFCRVMLQSSGVHFAPTYLLKSSAVEFEEEKVLAEEPFFEAAVKVAQSKIGSTSGDFFLAVAGRSAEFHVINTALNDGSQLENLVLTSPIIIL